MEEIINFVDCKLFGMGNGNWTDQVVVILISWSGAVVDPVRLGHLVYLFFSSSQTKETRVELYELKS